MNIQLHAHETATGAVAALAPGEVVVATEIVASGGSGTRCPAAPVAWGMLRRKGVAARRGVVSIEPGGIANAVLLSGHCPLDAGRSVAMAIATRLNDPAAVSAGRQVLARVAAAWRARTVILASPRSFCAGVERAIGIVERILASRSAPVFVRKQIVHNAHVVRRLERRGAVFVNVLDAVPEGATVVFSAHGVAPAVRAQAAARGLEVVDATCPLVTKVHAEARRFAGRGDTVVLIGHDGHEEVEGILGEAPGRTVLVQTAADAATVAVPDPDRVAYLTQTTLAVDETAGVVEALRERFPAIHGPGSEDICYATTNRQLALRAIVEEADLVLVVGSDNSSNSLRLVELAGRHGKPAHLVDDATDIEPEWLAGAGRVGLTAGASAPQELVADIIDALDGLGPLRVLQRQIAQETVEFALPRTVVGDD